MRADVFRPLNEFKHAMDERIQELRSSKLAEGFDRILVPGEIEFETEIQRKKEGIPMLHLFSRTHLFSFLHAGL